VATSQILGLGLTSASAATTARAAGKPVDFGDASAICASLIAG